MGADATSLSWADKHMLTSIAFQFKNKPTLLNSNVKTECEISVCIDNQDLHLFSCGFCDIVMVFISKLLILKQMTCRRKYKLGYVNLI